MSVIQFVVIIFGVTFTVQQIEDMKNNQLSKRYDLYVSTYDRLNSGTNRQVMLAVSKNIPILKSEGGRFTEDQVDDYLGELQDVNDKMNRDLLSTDLVCQGFYYIAKDTLSNRYIQKYITENEKVYPGVYSWVDDLSEFMKTCQ